MRPKGRQSCQTDEASSDDSDIVHGVSGRHAFAGLLEWYVVGGVHKGASWTVDLGSSERVCIRFPRYYVATTILSQRGYPYNRWGNYRTFVSTSKRNCNL